MSTETDLWSPKLSLTEKVYELIRKHYPDEYRECVARQCKMLRILNLGTELTPTIFFNCSVHGYHGTCAA